MSDDSPTVPRLLVPLRVGIRSVWRHRSRFLLITLTLIAAFASSFTLSATLSSVQRRIRGDLRGVGLDLINIHPDPDPTRFFAHGLTVSDCERFAGLVSGECAPANVMSTLARTEDATDEIPVLALATTPAWDRVARHELIAGRFFGAGETDACVVDEWVYKRLFPEGATLDPNAPTLDLLVAGEPHRLRVVGVVRDPFRIRQRFEEWDAMGSARSHLVRFMEFKSVYVPRSLIGGGDTILLAVVRAGDGVDPIDGAARIREYLEERGSTAWVWARQEWVDSILDATAFVDVISGFLTFMILAVTALMVATVILIVIRGRFREIAVRRVEGADRRQILLQVVVENAAVAAVSAVVGLALAAGATRWLGDLLGVPVALGRSDVLLVGVFGMLVVIAAGALPARRAAGVDPVEVIRREL